ncbi:CopG family transcriptional regulator [Amaricoccus sp.]|uniref:CopG family transcriptional regulator n=1 Tax=Amaricoccus sp. TaxID=1872485 RepID=UPI002604250A|nr:CopG family transcriptional regulator [uncultured Amaricoccus sp.]
MSDNVRQLRDRDRGGDTEKITINLGFVDLGRIDLLVREGFYSNRTDLIRTAIRNQLESHAETVSRSVTRHMFEMGLRDFGREELEAARAAGETFSIRVVGLVRIAADVTPELARATIGAITVLGALQASPAVKAALADRVE